MRDRRWWLMGNMRLQHRLFYRLQVAMKACPYRADFYTKLAADPAGGPSVPADQLNEELNKWLAALDSIVQRLEEFYEKGGHNKGF